MENNTIKGCQWPTLIIKNDTEKPGYEPKYSKFGLSIHSTKGEEFGINQFSSHITVFVDAGATVIGHRYQEKFSRWIKNTDV
jgi:hypothetical protein